jgi:hypothetical protein
LTPLTQPDGLHQFPAIHAALSKIDHDISENFRYSRNERSRITDIICANCCCNLPALPVSYLLGGKCSMSQSQRDLRRAAAREFQKSLDQLGSNLQSTKSEKVRPTREETAIEEALADIEQFMQSWNA